MSMCLDKSENELGDVDPTPVVLRQGKYCPLGGILVTCAFVIPAGGGPLATIAA